MDNSPEPTVKLEPAYSLIQELGGNKKIAENIGVSPKTVWSWQAKCGTKGKIPKAWYYSLSTLGQEKGINIPIEVFC